MPVSTLSDGLGSYDPSEPTAFISAMLGKAAGIFALSQIVFHSVQPTVARLGGTQPPTVAAPTEVAPNT